MPSKVESITSKYLEQSVSRRKVIKAGGIAALGLIFVKPTIDTLRPPPVYGQVSAGPQRDTTPPEHGWQFKNSRVCIVEIQDIESGLCYISDSGSVNAHAGIPDFVSGVTSPVIVTSERLSNGPATLRLSISACAGNSTVCEVNFPSK
jgi:hypothetical protein